MSTYKVQVETFIAPKIDRLKQLTLRYSLFAFLQGDLVFVI